MNISDFARQLLQLHADRPRTLFYGIGLLGSFYRDTDVKRLDAAYDELASAGLLAKPQGGPVISFFGDPKPLYQVTDAGIEEAMRGERRMSLEYLQDVLAHFDSFAQSHGVEPGDVHVRFFLADSSSYFVRALKVSPPIAPGGLGLIAGVGQRSTSALAVREQHIVKVEFALNPPETTPIGLHTEASRP